jgi:hypothetical protein
MKLIEILDIYRAEEQLNRLPSRDEVGYGLKEPIIPFYKSSSYQQAFGITDVEVHKQLETAPIEELNIADLVTWQNWINPDKIMRMVKDIKAGKFNDSTIDPVSVVSKDSKNVIIGGNHRITALMLTGKKTIKAKHLTL